MRKLEGVVPAVVFLNLCVSLQENHLTEVIMFSTVSLLLVIFNV